MIRITVMEEILMGTQVIHRMAIPMDMQAIPPHTVMVFMGIVEVVKVNFHLDLDRDQARLKVENPPNMNLNMMLPMVV